ncbi:N-acetyl-D-glucosamine kinase-like isoform X1 [Penaeus japonicus]|uniref:N-acetyl-D-glucosamine kinase-like isoform X1 n=1 Tax=Penaeus japonicus TaxID=27405 RepID=UPI001C70CD3E|nr:N-acetyl-D-glucosamine kinase-like isoform X1 [Penaeus japonicus]
MVNAKLIFGGIEGGGTHSWIVLMDGRGEKVAELEGPSTNHWLIGMSECQARIKQLVDDAKEMAGLPQDTTLEGLGLCLSGCEDEEGNRDMAAALMKRYPALARNVIVSSDTKGSIATACQNGGIVLISGTGSNALLLNPDGNTYRCGGWGHLLGDEGGAYWIAARAVKLLFDEDDNLIDPPFNTSQLRDIVYTHFELKDRGSLYSAPFSHCTSHYKPGRPMLGQATNKDFATHLRKQTAYEERIHIDRFGMLQHCYQSFEKAKFASLTAKISHGASSGDAMCARILYDAGFALGRHIAALSRNIHEALLFTEDGLQIVCSGSVWKAWEHLRPGFVDGIIPRCEKDRIIPKYTLLRLAVTSALGAIYLGASVSKYDLPRDYGKNARAFFTHVQPESLGATKVATPKLQMKFPKSLTPKTQPKFPQNHTEAVQCEKDHENGHSNGHANGHSNGHANGHSNGHANGHSNGHANGHSNGHANGHSNGLSNGHANGHSNGHSNGFANGHDQSNGHANGHSNGIFTLAAEGTLVDSTSR